MEPGDKANYTLYYMYEVVYYYNIGDVGTKEVTMTDIAIQCTTHDNTSGNVHVITVQSIITFIYATCTCTFTLTVSIQ